MVSTVGGSYGRDGLGGGLSDVSYYREPINSKVLLYMGNDISYPMINRNGNDTCMYVYN